MTQQFFLNTQLIFFAHMGYFFFQRAFEEGQQVSEGRLLNQEQEP